MIILDKLAAIIGPVIAAIEKILTVMFVRKVVQSEAENKQLKNENQKQKDQLKISARPPRPWHAILELMRLGKR